MIKVIEGNKPTKNYDTQPAPSGHPTPTIKPHHYGDTSMNTTKEGKRKQLCIDLGIELGRTVYKELKTGELYQKQHGLNYTEIGILVDFMYNEIFKNIYADKYPSDSTYQDPKARIGRVGGKLN